MPGDGTSPQRVSVSGRRSSNGRRGWFPPAAERPGCPAGQLGVCRPAFGGGSAGISVPTGSRRHLFVWEVWGSCPVTAATSALDPPRGALHPQPLFSPECSVTTALPSGIIVIRCPGFRAGEDLSSVAPSPFFSRGPEVFKMFGEQGLKSTTLFLQPSSSGTRNKSVSFHVSVRVLRCHLLVSDSRSQLFLFQRAFLTDVF